MALVLISVGATEPEMTDLVSQSDRLLFDKPGAAGTLTVSYIFRPVVRL